MPPIVMRQRSQEAVALEEIFCRILLGKPLSSTVAGDDSGVFLNESAYHGIQPLLYRMLKRRGWVRIIPDPLYEALRKRALNEAAVQTIQQLEITRVLEALYPHAVLLMKGTPLAFSHYPFPSYRPRADTDLLIFRPETHAICNVLEGLGYTRTNATSGEWLTSEVLFSKKEFSVEHTVDLHWRINSAPIFSNAFAFNELLEASVPVPALGDHARALHDVHAMLLACIHRVAHFHVPYYSNGRAYYGGDRLIWLYDIHLLAKSLSLSAWERLVDLATARNLCSVCLNGLEVTREKLGSEFPKAPMEVLARNAARESVQASDLTRSPLRFMLSNWRSLPSRGAQLQFVRDHLFPSRSYMRNKYGTQSALTLCYFYFVRIVTGSAQRLIRILRQERSARCNTRQPH